MKNLLYREGDCWSVTQLPEFSLAAISQVCGFDRSVIRDELDATDLTVEHFAEINQTVVNFFNSDGESTSWIGYTTDFVE